MPRLACWSCGRQSFATPPLESLFGDERRCPRCGMPMNLERRAAERRALARRRDPGVDPGPPAGVDERRRTERRLGPGRRVP